MSHRAALHYLRASAPAVFLTWAVVGIFRFAHHTTYNYPREASVATALYYTADALRWALFTLFILWFVQRRPAASLSRLQLFTVVAPLLLGSVGAMMAIDALIFSNTARVMVGVSPQTALYALLQKRFHRMLLDSTTVLIIAYGINIQRSLAAEALRSARLESAVTEMRLTALRQQLNPHLLFNTLHSISALVRSEPEAAERMLARLSELFRAILRVGLRTTIPLREDLALVEAFLRIQEYRFPDGLRAETDIPSALLDTEVPTLLLQPLVENCIKHGLEGASGPAVISISAAVADEDLVLRVHDAGPRLQASGGRQGFGVGLGQMRERLERMFGAAASVSLSTSPAVGTTVTVRFPLQSAADA